MSALAGGVYYAQMPTQRRPIVQEVDGGWTFAYDDLCVPAPPPLPCVPAKRTLFITKGYESNILPQSRRLKSVDTVDDAREEAEKVADMVEGKYKGEPR